MFRTQNYSKNKKSGKREKLSKKKIIRKMPTLKSYKRKNYLTQTLKQLLLFAPEVNKSHLNLNEKQEFSAYNQILQQRPNDNMRNKIMQYLK